LDLINFCESHDIRFCYTPSLVGLYAVNSAIDPIAGYPLIEIKPTPLDGWGRIAKRLFDFSLTAVGLILLSPLLILIAILVRLTSPGPALYIQKRPGQLGKSFNLYKFRSMYTHLSTGDKYGGKVAEDLRTELKTTRNEGAGLLFKVKDDPRATKLGKFIRRTSIDELPQLFNVLKGEMSLVGPRPPLFDEVEKYDRGQLRRMLVKPGVTGMWQASGRSETSFDEYMKLDMYYIEHWSLLLDIQIILRTFWVVIKGRGAY
jgi:exopolysaccharide biosynthesis polyprenyl glycosylphosphotransferase